MATTILTGRQCALTIDGNVFTDQISTATLAYANDVSSYNTWSGLTSVITGQSGTLSVTFFQDWQETAALSEGLWAAAEAQTAIAFELEIEGSLGTSTWTGTVVPQFPGAGGGVEALEDTVEFVLTGSVVLT